MTNSKIDKFARTLFPSISRLTYNVFIKIFLELIDIFQKLFHVEFRRLPPSYLRVRIGVGNNIFLNQVHYLTMAESFWLFCFVSNYCDLNSTILDIGVGCGRYAHHIRDFEFCGKKFQGRYIGIDIDTEMLSWCKNNFDSQRFEFHHSTNNSKSYKNVSAKDQIYSIPTISSTVDLVFCASLFTHLLESELQNYLCESYRVLKKYGTLLASCFCIDHLPPTFGGRHTFKYKINNAHIESPRQPEAAVAYSKKFLFNAAKRAGFADTRLIFGKSSIQPFLICKK